MAKKPMKKGMSKGMPGKGAPNGFGDNKPGKFGSGKVADKGMKK